MSGPVDIDAARKAARSLGAHLGQCREHMTHTKEHDAAVAAVVEDAELLGALVLTMVAELESWRRAHPTDPNIIRDLERAFDRGDSTEIT